MFSGDFDPHLAALGWPELFAFLTHGVQRLTLRWLEVRTGSPVHLGCVYLVRPEALLVPARFMSAVFGTLLVAAVASLAGDLARSPSERGLARLSAGGLLAVSPLLVREAHFAVTDTILVFAMTMAVREMVKTRRSLTLRRAGQLGFWVAFAVSVKWTGLVLIPAAGWFLFVSFRDQRLGARRLLPFAAICGGSFLLFFVVFDPHIALSPSTLVKSLTFYFDWYRPVPLPGHVEPSGRIGASFYLVRALPAAFGWPGLLLVLVALAWALRHPTSDVGSLAVFVLAFFGIVLVPNTVVYARYVMPIVPSLCAITGCAVALSVTRLGPGRLAAVAPVVVLAISALLALDRSLSVDRMLESEDTRVEATKWLLRHSTHDDRVAVNSWYGEVPAISKAARDGCSSVLPRQLRRPVLANLRDGAAALKVIREGRRSWWRLADSEVMYPVSGRETRRATWIIETDKVLDCRRLASTDMFTGRRRHLRLMHRIAPGGYPCGTPFEPYEAAFWPLPTSGGSDRGGPQISIFRTAERPERESVRSMQNEVEEISSP